MNEVGVFKDNSYLDDKDQEIKWLEQSYSTAQAQIARLEKSLVIKDDTIEGLRSLNDNANSLIASLREELTITYKSYDKILNHWLYKLHKGITNLHKVRLHVKE
jgi:hypothetical protein